MHSWLQVSTLPVKTNYCKYKTMAKFKMCLLVTSIYLERIGRIHLKHFTHMNHYNHQENSFTMSETVSLFARLSDLYSLSTMCHVTSTGGAEQSAPTHGATRAEV